MLLEENCMSSTSRVVYAFIRTTYRPSSSPCFNLFFFSVSFMPCLLPLQPLTADWSGIGCWQSSWQRVWCRITTVVTFAKQYSQFARIALSAWCLFWESAGFHPLKSEGMQLVMPPLGSEKPWQTMIKRFLMNGIMFICGFYPCLTFFIGAPVWPQVMNVFH